MVKTYVKNWF